MARHTVWKYLGDLRCPCHRCYGRIWAKGRGDRMVLRLQCKSTGKIWMKTLYSRWYSEEEFNKYNDERYAELRDLALRLKGGGTHG